MTMRKFQSILAGAFVITAAALASGQSTNSTVSAPHDFDQLIDRVAAREAAITKSMGDYSPIVETYIQNMRSDRELGALPERDYYFLEKLSFRNPEHDRERAFLKGPGPGRAMLTALTSMYKMEFMPLGFAQMIVIDERGLDRNSYNFAFVRREFLGDLRCMVIDVQPKAGSGMGRFLGRIWVEDQDYTIVRFNGTFSPAKWRSSYLHFDTWRQNMQPGVWLPAYVYSEESDLPFDVFRHTVRFKAQTRIWGYNLGHSDGREEFSRILVETDNGVNDRSQGGQDAAPVQAQRDWERMAEQNVVDRLTRAGLLAPEGEVDQVLTTVVNNLIVTNNLDIQPAVRARVMLTTPMETFSIGQTIVVSRGLLDVLPDEATLAAVLAHELAHLALGHRFDTKYAFGDRLIFPDDATLRRINFHRDPKEESEADKLALQYLQNSPYKDKLTAAGLFMKQVQDRHKELPNLVQAHMGNGMFFGGEMRLSSLATAAPALQPRNVKQIASLPLGGRIHVNPWNDQIELSKSATTPPVKAREKMPLEVTPWSPYLTRFNAVPIKQEGKDEVASKASQ
jgi:Peptidase family M48